MKEYQNLIGKIVIGASIIIAVKNKFITIFAIVGAFAAAGIILYIFNCKRLFDGIKETN